MESDVSVAVKVVVVAGYKISYESHLEQCILKNQG